MLFLLPAMPSLHPAMPFLLPTKLGSACHITKQAQLGPCSVLKKKARLNLMSLSLQLGPNSDRSITRLKLGKTRKISLCRQQEKSKKLGKTRNSESCFYFVASRKSEEYIALSITDTSHLLFCLTFVFNFFCRQVPTNSLPKYQLIIYVYISCCYNYTFYLLSCLVEL